jgi:pimeloyl-ACP methyl ester carboxylesterase
MRTAWPRSNEKGDDQLALWRLNFPTTSDFGSVHDVPLLPIGFTGLFESYLVEAEGLVQHAVVGGEGPPLLLLCGWPQSWYAWRFIMAGLADRFTIIAPDPRGVGLSEKPDRGYDSTTLANDLFALMDRLGHERFAMVGFDVGMWTGYAMAADRPGRIARIALGEAIIPGVSPPPPLIPDDRRRSDRLWHFNFNRALEVNEQLVSGREAIYFGYQFRTKAGSPEALSAAAQAYYIEQLRRDPKALKASFEFYRAIDESIPQHRERMKSKLKQPVLAFAGRLFAGDVVERELRTLADDVTSVIIEGSGHYPAEEKPDALIEAFEQFFEPYRNAV